MPHVLMPAWIAESLPPELAGGVATHDGGPATADLAEIRFYVPPYMGPAADLELMASMPSLEVVQALTAGVDNIWPHLPVTATLASARGVHDASTAELAVGLLIARLRRLDEFARSDGEWLHGRYDALADKRVMVIGQGNVGRAICDRLAPFEVELVRVSRTAVPGISGFDALPGLLPTVDAVIVIVPQTAETTGMVDAAFLARMRDGAVLVNVARGPVVVTDALLAEVRTGRLRAALDVTDPEPLPPGHPLWQERGVLISPHVGGNTTAFPPRARRLVREQLARWSRGEPLENLVARPGS